MVIKLFVYYLLNRPSITSALELWSQKILWSVGHSGNLRLADRLKSNNNTVAVLMLLMSLPGTPSILYGDEIGLKGLHDPNNDVSTFCCKSIFRD